MLGSKKALHSNEPRPSCVELSEMHSSIECNILWNIVSSPWKGVAGREIVVAGDNAGGGMCREVSISSEHSPTRNSFSGPSDKQKSKRILNANDEFGGTCTQLQLGNSY